MGLAGKDRATAEKLLTKDGKATHTTKIRHLDAKNPKQASVIELLHEAAKKDNLIIVQSLLLDSHINPDTVDNKGWSAALRAAKSGSLKVLPFLIECRASVNIQTKEGNSALHKAAKRNHAEIVNALLSSRADVNSANHGGVTPLMMSVLHQARNSVLGSLLAAKANVDAQKDVGYSAFMLAARVGNAHAVHELLKAKADPELMDKQGETAYVKAAKHNRSEVVELLLQSGAVPHPAPGRVSNHHGHHGHHTGHPAQHDGHRNSQTSGHLRSGKSITDLLSVDRHS